MEPWLIAVLAIAGAILLLFAAGWARRIVLRSSEHEVEVEAPPSGRFRSRRSRFFGTKVKGRGADLHFDDSVSDDSKFDIR